MSFQIVLLLSGSESRLSSQQPYAAVCGGSGAKCWAALSIMVLYTYSLYEELGVADSNGETCSSIAIC